MTDPRPSVLHLSDADIDAYWKGALSDSDEERVEQHYLDCNECAARVRVVEDLLDLRGQPAAPISDAFVISRRQALVFGLGAAAVLVIGVAGGYQWAETLRTLGQTSGPPASTSTGATTVTHLAPPTRDSNLQEMAVPASGVVVFELDTREAGVAGTRFDLTLTDASGRAVARLSGVQSNAAGLVRLPVESSILAPGRYVFDLSAGHVVVGYPFLIRP
jgi:hypothetical protein